MKKKCPFYGVNYNSVAQKLRVVAIKAIFDPKNPFPTDSMDESIKIKANNLIKLRLQVVNIKKASLAMEYSAG